MTIKASVFAGKNNRLSLRLLSGGVSQDLTSITRITVEVGLVTVDSNVNPEAFDWETYATEGRIDFYLGRVLTQETHQYLPATVTLYDAEYTAGIVWEEDCSVPNLKIKVC